MEVTHGEPCDGIDALRRAATAFVDGGNRMPGRGRAIVPHDA